MYNLLKSNVNVSRRLHQKRVSRHPITSWNPHHHWDTAPSGAVIFQHDIAKSNPFSNTLCITSNLWCRAYY